MSEERLVSGHGMLERERKTLPMLDLTGEIAELWDDVTNAIHDVIRSGRFILGPVVEKFETEVASYLGVPYAVGVNSGTDALVIALRALGVGPGDEVITTPFTFFATAEAISHVGAAPVFVDIDEKSFNIEPTAIEGAITHRTRAILPVHLFGRPAEMGAVNAIARAHDLLVLEDCAQSFGAVHDGLRTGAIGHAGALSFFPSKNLGGFGDGGMVVTSDAKIAAAARMLRAHGAATKYRNKMLGYNSRLDALQAAVLAVKLSRVERSNEERREAAARYNDLLASVSGITLPDVTPGHVFHQYTVTLVHHRRDVVRRALDRHGIASAVYYPVPCHQLPVYSDLATALPRSERASREVLSLPIWPGISMDQQRRVAEVVAHPDM